MKKKIELMCGILGMRYDDVTSKHRHRPLKQARQMISRILKDDDLEYNLTEIGQSLGGRDHSTIINNLRQHETDMLYDTYESRYLNMRKRYLAISDHDEEETSISTLLHRNNMLLELILERLQKSE